MGGFFQALAAGLAGAGEQAGPFRDRENANRLRVWETGKSELMKSVDGLIAGATDPHVRNELLNVQSQLATTIPGDKNQMKLLEKIHMLGLGGVHPDLNPLFKQSEVPKGPGPAAPGTMPGSLQEKPQATQSSQQNLTGNFASMLSGQTGQNPQAQIPATAQPTESPVQPGSTSMPDLNITATAPQGSGSTTYDRLSALPFVTPMQWQMANPIIQAELQGQQRAIDAETSNAQRAWEIQNTPHGMTQGMQLVGGDGRVIYQVPEAQPIHYFPTGAAFDPKTGKDIRPPDTPPKIGTPFNAAYQQFVEENDRVPTTEEINQINSGLRGGEPMYRVLDPDGVVRYRPRGSATGAAAPNTVYNLSGMPTTGGVAGVSMQAPPALDAATQTQLTGLKTTIDQATKVGQLLNNPEFTTLGPVLGRVKLAAIEKLGGLGATPKQIQLATALKRLLSTNAFAQGGKNLTATELNLIQPTFPQMTDTLEAAITKTRDAIKFYNQFYQDRVRMMSPRQQGQVPSLTPMPIGSSGGTPPKTGAGYLRSIGMGQ